MADLVQDDRGHDSEKEIEIAQRFLLLVGARMRVAILPFQRRE